LLPDVKASRALKLSLCRDSERGESFAYRSNPFVIGKEISSSSGEDGPVLLKGNTGPQNLHFGTGRMPGGRSEEKISAGSDPNLD
jgi:hypothetical protein